MAFHSQPSNRSGSTFCRMLNHPAPAFAHAMPGFPKSLLRHPAKLCVRSLKRGRTMESLKKRNSALIARYKREASARRDSSVLKTEPGQGIANAVGNSSTSTLQRQSTKVRITNRAGEITVDTSGAKPLARSADKSKIFGRSSILIPEYRLYRK